VVTPLPLTLPTVAQKNAALEPFEGMLVTVVGPLTVTNNFQLGTFGQISLSAKGRVYTGTQVRLSGCHNRVDSGWLIVQFRHQSVCTCTCQYLCWSSSGASKVVHRFCRWLSRVRPLRLWTPASRSLSLTTAAAAATPFPFHILRQVHTGFIRQNFLHLRQQQKTSLHLACSSNSADLRWNVCSCACACTILMLLALPNAELSYNNSLRTGATTDSITGVLTFSNADWRVHPTVETTFDLTQNGRSGPPDVGAHRATISSFNVRGIWPCVGFCRHDSCALDATHLIQGCSVCKANSDVLCTGGRCSTSSTRAPASTAAAAPIAAPTTPRSLPASARRSLPPSRPSRQTSRA